MYVSFIAACSFTVNLKDIKQKGLVLWLLLLYRPIKLSRIIRGPFSKHSNSSLIENHWIMQIRWNFFSTAIGWELLRRMSAKKQSDNPAIFHSKDKAYNVVMLHTGINRTFRINDRFHPERITDLFPRCHYRLNLKFESPTRILNAPEKIDDGVCVCVKMLLHFTKL